MQDPSGNEWQIAIYCRVQFARRVSVMGTPRDQRGEEESPSADSDSSECRNNKCRNRSLGTNLILGVSAFTARQAEESAISIEQAQRHHEQSLMPIVLVRTNCKRIIEQPPEQATRMVIGVDVTLINSGLGPAVAVYLHLKMAAYNPQHTIYLGLIGPKQERTAQAVFPLDAPFQTLLWFPYDCVTRYRTIFDSEGAIVQYSHSVKERTRW